MAQGEMSCIAGFSKKLMVWDFSHPNTPSLKG
jgi:hypothetical protein